MEIEGVKITESGVGSAPVRGEVTMSPVASHEIIPVSPRKVMFGSLTVEEDIATELVSLADRDIYQRGFSRLERLIAAIDADNSRDIGTRSIEKMVLTSPDMVSGIVGVQPLVGMYEGETIALYQAFERAQIDFDSVYSVFEFGRYQENRPAIRMVLNDKAAFAVLTAQQDVLGITIGFSPSKEEIQEVVIKLMGDTDPKKANLAFGLLSGFPLEDCQEWIETHTVSQLPTLNILQKEALDSKYSLKVGIDPTCLLNAERYNPESGSNQYLPDKRNALYESSGLASVEGFGLRWVSSFPPKSSTLQHCQRLLEIDRGLTHADGKRGLIAFIQGVQSSFSAQDNMRLIAARKELHEGQRKTVVQYAKGGLAVALNVVSMFGSVFLDALNQQQQLDMGQERRLRRDQ